MNRGMADAVDLGWKLAGVLQGWAAPELLATYEVERKPVHDLVMDEAVANHALLSHQLYRDGLEDDTPAGVSLRCHAGARIRAAKEREVNTPGGGLGYCYTNTPASRPDGNAPPPAHFR